MGLFFPKTRLGSLMGGGCVAQVYHGKFQGQEVAVKAGNGKIREDDCFFFLRGWSNFMKIAMVMEGIIYLTLWII